MSLDITNGVRPYQTDTIAEADLEHATQVMDARDAASARITATLHTMQEHLAALTAQQEDTAQRFEGLEAVARAALATITTDAAQRLNGTVESAETRIMDALTLLETHQREITRWREDAEERFRAQLRDLGEWDETLTEMRHEIGGLREMAEASVSLASGDLDRRWDGMRREISDILASAESDERARWEAFMATATETLASHSGIDLGELHTVRADVAQLRDAATQTITQIQGAQREQMAALRSEIRTLIETERSSISAGVDQRLEEARKVFLAQVQSLQDWQGQVGRDVATLKTTAQAAEADAREAKSALQAETQGARAAIRSEVEQGVAQSRVAVQAALGEVRADTERLIKRSQMPIQGRLSLVMLLTILALIFGIGALIVPFLHVK
jgi:hypothetical protein